MTQGSLRRLSQNSPGGSFRNSIILGSLHQGNMVGLLLSDTRERAGKKTQSLPMRGLQWREGQRQPEVRGEKTKDGRSYRSTEHGHWNWWSGRAFLPEQAEEKLDLIFLPPTLLSRTRIIAHIREV